MSLTDFLGAGMAQRCRNAARPQRVGRVVGLVGLGIEIAGLDVAIGELIHVGADATPAEVVAIERQRAVAMPLGRIEGLRFGDPVTASGTPLTVPVGHGLMGRVLDGLGRPIDDGGPVGSDDTVSIHADAPHPLRRPRIEVPLQLGIRAIDTLTPVGRGQRMAIMAGSGVGKSSLLSMMIRGTDADLSVLALVGERGREVREFLEADLGPEGLARSVVVVATSDAPALVRRTAAFLATRIAEWFRDQGLHVNLLMDSLTRVAMAQREIGLAAGEPPATRGYPPSVFGLLPTLLERAGTSDRGSVTGLYTVLVEADDLNDPVGDTVRSIVDGHISLSREMASAGHFPAIDVLHSVSRAAGSLQNPHQAALARDARSLIAAHRHARDLVDIGAYVAGANPTLDRALSCWEAIEGVLRQDLHDLTPRSESWSRLAAALGLPDTGGPS